MVSYREALTYLLQDDNKQKVVHLLEKGDAPFRSIRAAAGFKHNHTLSQNLDKFEYLGLITHEYRHGSEQVYSFYSLTPFGKDIAEKLRTIEPLLGGESRRQVRKVKESRHVVERPRRTTPRRARKVLARS